MKFSSYKKSAEKNPEQEGVAYLLGKLLSTAVYLWSGFFWAGITIYNFYFLNKNETHLATMLLIGTLCLLVSLILTWKRVYIVQLPFALVGTVLFCVVASEMMAVAEATAVTFPVSFGYRYLPALGFGAIALAFFAVKLYKIIEKKKKAEDAFNNSPAKSILED